MYLVCNYLIKLCLFQIMGWNMAKEKFKRYTLRLEQEVDENLQRLAKKNGLSMASMIRFLIMQELNKQT